MAWFYELESTERLVPTLESLQVDNPKALLRHLQTLHSSREVESFLKEEFARTLIAAFKATGRVEESEKLCKELRDDRNQFTIYVVDYLMPKFE